MKRVLVTGATGCVGRQVLPKLVRAGWEVHTVTSRDVPPDIDPVVWHRANLLDPEQAQLVVDRVAPTHLLHLAWYIAPGRWAFAPENFQWVRASLVLLDAFQRRGGRRIVGAGSCLEYDWRYGYCSETLTPCVPHTTYGVCKHALQRLTQAFSETHGLTAAWGRIFFLFGPHEHPDRLVSSVIRALLMNQPARCSHGDQIRDYLFVDDVADLFVRLLESDLTGPINIASGEPIRLRDIVNRIGVLLGRPELIELGAIPAAPTDTPLVVADVARLRDEMNWRPHVGLDEGLSRSIDWWRSRPVAMHAASEAR
jgi:nucleoside-diphosphate-sugar epimerase